MSQSAVVSAIIAGVATLDRYIGTKKMTKNLVVITDAESEADWEDRDVIDGLVQKMNNDEHELTIM